MLEPTSSLLPSFPLEPVSLSADRFKTSFEVLIEIFDLKKLEAFFNEEETDFRKDLWERLLVTLRLSDWLPCNYLVEFDCSKPERLSVKDLLFIQSSAKLADFQTEELPNLEEAWSDLELSMEDAPKPVERFLDVVSPP